MTKGDVESIVYSCIISTLKNVTVNNNRVEPRIDNPDNVNIAYQSRPSFQYHYQRDKFLASRDKYVTVYHNLALKILAKESHGTRIVIYSKPLELLGINDKKSIDIAVKMLRKIYEKVDVEEWSDVGRADLSRRGPQSLVGTYYES